MGVTSILWADTEQEQGGLGVKHCGLALSRSIVGLGVRRHCALFLNRTGERLVGADEAGIDEGHCEWC